MNEDMSELQGTWQAVRMEVASGLLPAETARRLRYVFEGGGVTLLEDGKPSGTGDLHRAIEGSAQDHRCHHDGRACGRADSPRGVPDHGGPVDHAHWAGPSRGIQPYGGGGAG